LKIFLLVINNNVNYESDLLQFVKNENEMEVLNENENEMEVLKKMKKIKSRNENQFLPLTIEMTVKMFSALC